MLRTILDIAMRSLTKIEQWEGPLIPGYEFKAISLPDGSSYDHDIWDCDIRSVEVPYNSGHLWFRVTSCDNGELAASAVFGGGSAFVQCDNIEVFEKYRKGGIALALYQWAACFFEAPVTPTNKRSALSKKFWNGKSSIECDCIVSGEMGKCVRLGR